MLVYNGSAGQYEKGNSQKNICLFLYKRNDENITYPLLGRCPIFCPDMATAIKEIQRLEEEHKEGLLNKYDVVLRVVEAIYVP